MSKQDHNIVEEFMLRTGTILDGKYRIDDYLSSGGFGNTYVATHIYFNEKRAIKEFFMKGVNERDSNNTTISVSNTEKVDEFNEQLKKFKKEAQRLRKLNNEHIVHVHDLFDENGTAYYIMDYINGENLKERLIRTRKPMDESEVRNILLQVLDALQEVHSQELYHLDLKPANVMIDRNGVVKLIDFGASKQFNNKTGGAVSSSAVTFTNGYAPIEQMEKSYEKFGPWTDFYALGATLYNLLTNQRPPMPSDINDDTTLDKHLALPMPEEVSVKMRDLVLWLMRPNRLERPTSVQDILGFLNSTSRGQDPKDNNEETIINGAKEKPVTRQAKTQLNSKPTGAKSNGSGNPYIKSNRNLIIGIIAAAVAAVGLFIILRYSGGSAITDNPAEDTTKVIVDKVKTVKDLNVKITLGNCSYTGEVNDDSIPNGRGIAKFPNGDKCEGTFVNGDVTGENVRYDFADGDSFVGTFQNNGFYKGRYTTGSDGSYFEGAFKDNMPDEKNGQWFDKNGNKMK